MKITVLNGSPKGDTSVTMQYIEYINKSFPGNAMTVHNISQRIKALDKDRKSFDAVVNDIRSSELVIWAFPLYYFLVPSQYKRFIELVFERKAAAAFKSKFTAVLTTSIHFFDHTAHNYMRAICDDLGMKFAGSFSASMYDLMKSGERDRLREFAGLMLGAVENNTPASRAYVPVRRKGFAYKPSTPKLKVDPGAGKILIISDAGSPSSNLAKMVERLRASFTAAPPAVVLRDIDIKGGCLGCIQCGYDNRCVYGDSDGYHEFFETRVKTADIIFYCFETRERCMSALWKTFLDRSFYNNHVPVLSGKQIGFLVSGPLADMTSFNEFLHAFPELQMANLVDIVTDEECDSRGLDLRIQNIARAAVEMAGRRYLRPMTFLGIGGGKIFRDDIRYWLRFPFVADHRYYKKHGFYASSSVPMKQRIMTSLLIRLSGIPGFRNEVYKKRMKEEMIKPLKSVLKRPGT
jgi:multimeric flavodoxin WrbA